MEDLAVEAGDEKKKSGFFRCLRAMSPMRILCRGRDRYMKSMMSCTSGSAARSVAMQGPTEFAAVNLAVSPADSGCNGSEKLKEMLEEFERVEALLEANNGVGGAGPFVSGGQARAWRRRRRTMATLPLSGYCNASLTTIHEDEASSFREDSSTSPVPTALRRCNATTERRSLFDELED